MYWLGLAKCRTSALAALETAFGPGDIEVDTLGSLNHYVEVQLRLVEGLRRLARRESLEQLCEFMTDGDRLRIRTWFCSMRRDSDGHVDIGETQSLFARMEVTTDRQAMYRFLSHFKSRSIASATTFRAAKSHGQGGQWQRSFSIEEFASLLCRRIVTWCL